MIRYLLLFICFLPGLTDLFAQNADTDSVNPLDLKFHRLAVRRFIFSNNIPLSEFVPSEIVSFESMHPAFAPSLSGKQQCDTSFHAKSNQGRLLLNKECGKIPASFYIGAVNPYATYEIDIHSLSYDGDKAAEVGFELARLGLKDRVQLFAKSSSTENGIYLRIYKDGNVEREVKYSSTIPNGKFTLRAQLYGHSL